MSDEASRTHKCGRSTACYKSAVLHIGENCGLVPFLVRIMIPPFCFPTALINESTFGSSDAEERQSKEKSAEVERLLIETNLSDLLELLRAGSDHAAVTSIPFEPDEATPDTGKHHLSELQRAIRTLAAVSQVGRWCIAMTAIPPGDRASLSQWYDGGAPSARMKETRLAVQEIESFLSEKMTSTTGSNVCSSERSDASGMASSSDSVRPARQGDRMVSYQLSLVATAIPPVAALGRDVLARIVESDSPASA